MYLITQTNSSLIKEIEYHEEIKELKLRFYRYYVDELIYLDVPPECYDALISSRSLGKFYLNAIKPNFKLKIMADRPKTINRCSKEKRFIKMSINTRLINKDWIFVGEKGSYLNITLMLLPDGEVDSYGNLGMIVQDVPKAIYQKDKKAQGPILGNGAELDFAKQTESVPGQEVGTMAADKTDEDWKDDLPF